MTLAQCKREFKKACKARVQAEAQYRKFLSKLYVRDRNTGEYVNAAQVCFLPDGDIAYVTSYADWSNMDNRIFTVARRRGNKIYLAVAGEDVWEQARQLQSELPKTYGAVIDFRLKLHLEFGLPLNEVDALRSA